MKGLALAWVPVVLALTGDSAPANSRTASKKIASASNSAMAPAARAVYRDSKSRTSLRCHSGESRNP